MKSELLLSSLVAGAMVAAALPCGAAPGASGATASPPASSAPSPSSPHLNFRSDSLDQVLVYYSDTLGFIIQKQAVGPELVELGGHAPPTPEAAVEALTRALKKSGHSLTQHGRVLTLARTDPRNEDSEVRVGADPRQVEKSSEMVTQVIPVRFVRASQLADNLRLLLPTSVTLSVNEGANTLLLAASKTDVRRALTVISVLEGVSSSVSTLKVIRLHYAEAKELATVVQQLFGTESTGQTTANQGGPGGPPGGDMGPGGPGGGGPGGPGGMSGSTSSSASGSNKGRVSVTSDEISNSLILSAPEASLAAISAMVAQVDQPVTELTELRVFKLQNADPTELAEQLTTLFPDPNQQGQDQAASRFGGMPGPPDLPGASPDSASADSGTSRKKGTVMAVPDARTASLLVSAPLSKMPLILKLIEQLDGIRARKEMVQTWDLHHADPQDLTQLLQDLFNRNSTARSSSNNRNSLLGENHPLTVRATRQQSASSATSLGLGGSGSGSGGGMGGGGGAGGGGGGGP